MKETGSSASETGIGEAALTLKVESERLPLVDHASSCQRKRAFATALYAFQFLMYLRSEHALALGQEVYQCLNCREWHLGHPVI